MYGHRFINIETEEEDNMADNQFASTIGALFQGMDEFVTTKTVVGEPVTVGDAIILPLAAWRRARLVSRRKRRMRAA